MYSKKTMMTFGLLAVLTLVLASCAPATAPTPKPAAPVAPTTAPAAKPAAPTAPPAAKPAAPTAAPAAKPAASPAVKPAAPAATPKPAAEQPRSGGIFNICTGGDPISLDLHQEVSFLTQNVVQCAYNGITQLDPENPEEVIGDLAKSWDISKDGLTYTFQLHDGVKFHDGTALAAEDVKFSFDRQVNPPKGIRAPRRADLAAIDRIDVPDKNTVRFILKYPSGPFMDVISTGFQGTYSKAFVEKKGDMKKEVMGSGPFKFKGYAIGTSLEYVKNPDYFVKGRPYLDGITIFIIKDAATRLAAFRTGQIKQSALATSGLSAADAEIIKKTMPQASLTPYSSFNHDNILLNTQEKPWTDIRVRKAVHLAIDRQAAIEVLSRGFAEQGSYMPGKWGVPKDELLKMPGWRQPKDADIADAKRLLAEAGYPQGFTVKALIRAGTKYENVGVFMADQLAKVGIKLELDVKEAAVRTAMLNQGTYNCHPGSATLNYPDPQNVTRYWAAPNGDDWGSNWPRFRDEQVLELFDKQSRAVDPAERKKIVRDLDLRLIDVAVRPIVQWNHNILALSPDVRGRGKLIGDYSFQKYQDVWLAK
ncbi:MAG: ABC transporter substrate-binding protein [Chloroflexota bacterium]